MATFSIDVYTNTQNISKITRIANCELKYHAEQLAAAIDWSTWPHYERHKIVDPTVTITHGDDLEPRLTAAHAEIAKLREDAAQTRAELATAVEQLAVLRAAMVVIEQRLGG